MPLEYYNYDRKRSGNFLVSSDYAVMTIISSDDSNAPGAVAKALIQDHTARYTQQVRVVPEAGSHEIYFLTGQPQGSVSLTRAIGQGGLMEGIHPGGAGTLNKGVIGSLQMEVSSADTASPGTVQAGLQFNNILRMSGIVLQDVAWSVNSGNLSIMESMNMVVASMVLDR